MAVLLPVTSMMVNERMEHQLSRNPDGTREQKPMEADEKVWEILLSAEKKDYERICAEYNVTDFRGMLKKLTEMKKQREEEIAAVRGLTIHLRAITALRQQSISP